MDLRIGDEDRRPVPSSSRLAPRRRIAGRSRMARLAAGLLFILVSATPAGAGLRDLRAGVAAYNRQAYVPAASIFLPLAEYGNARAQTYLGFMYAHGWGVPQNYEIAARWYESAARQGEAVAQYMLGLIYDKGQGVPQDYVTAYVWLNFAVAHVRSKDREYWTRVRDAVASKLSLAQLTQAQRLAANWQPLGSR
jgi:uncharacterized protein